MTTDYFAGDRNLNVAPEHGPMPLTPIRSGIGAHADVTPLRPPLPKDPIGNPTMEDDNNA